MSFWLEGSFMDLHAEVLPCLFLSSVLIAFNSNVVNETAPTERKGPFGTMTQLFLTMGIMISFCLGLVIPELKNDQDDLSQWRVS